jgi:hypothetical protein
MNEAKKYKQSHAIAIIFSRNEKFSRIYHGLWIYRKIYIDIIYIIPIGTMLIYILIVFL